MSADDLIFIGIFVAAGISVGTSLGRQYASAAVGAGASLLLPMGLVFGPMFC
jgi:hypothetical protein